MIESLHASNFRCFENLNLNALKQINILVGKNASGKTALLEAIRVSLSGTPQIVFWLSYFRTLAFWGQPGQATSPEVVRSAFDSVANGLFYSFDATREISIKHTSMPSRSFSLRIFYDVTKASASIAGVNGSPIPSVVVPLAFERIDPDGVKTVLHAGIGPQGQIALDPGPEMEPACFFFSSTIGYNPVDSANWFSQLSLHNREGEIIKALQEEFPYIEDVLVLSPSGFSSLYATVKSLREKLPLTLVSSGISRFFTLLLAMAYFRGGVILIDEIDNGLYYDRLPQVWSLLLRLSTQFDVQIFASTHSRECLAAALSAIEASESAFSLIRTERVNRSCSAKVFRGSDVRSAIEEGVEVR
jgi:predicted ATP-dependent endonuclease of OLD family